MITWYVYLTDIDAASYLLVGPPSFLLWAWLCLHQFLDGNICSGIGLGVFFWGGKPHAAQES